SRVAESAPPVLSLGTREDFGTGAAMSSPLRAGRCGLAGAEIGAGVPVASDDMGRARLSQLERFLKARTQLREQRNPALAAVVVLGLRRDHAEAIAIPIHVAPLKRQRLGRRPQAAVACERQQ